MRLSTITLEHLRMSGWSTNRKMNINGQLEALRREGYITNPLVDAFLTNFSGLKVKLQPLRPLTSEDSFEIDPILGINSVYIDTVHDYEDRVNEHLVVVGRAFHGHMVLLLSWEGRLYAGYDDVLIRLGNTIEEGLETLCEQKHGEEVA